MNKLYWLLASLALAIGAHLGHLPLWVGPLCTALGLWRVAVERGRMPFPNKALLFLLTAAATAGILMHFHTLFGRDAGVTLLVVMIALKLMEMKSPRDTMVVIFLSYFLVITGFLYSQSIPMALYLFVVVWVTTMTMIGYSDVNRALAVRPRLRLAGTLLIQAVPLMLVLFVLFPARAAVMGAAQGCPHRYDGAVRQHVAGRDQPVDPVRRGGVSRAVRRRAAAAEPALLARPGSVGLRRTHLVDAHAAGRRRTAGRTAPRAAALRTDFGTAQSTLGVRARTASACRPTAAPAPTCRSCRAIRCRRQRTPCVVPVSDSVPNEPTPSASAPPRPPPQTRSAHAKRARQWRTTQTRTRPSSTSAGVFNREFLHRCGRRCSARRRWMIFSSTPGSDFASTTSALRLPDACRRRAGARGDGLPGGVPNPLGDYFIVRQSDAHAWAEVWLAGRGWVRVDPTAAVSPDRVEQGIAASLPTAELPLALAQLNVAWLQRVRLSWDLVNNNWNQWVLGYSHERQRSFLARFHASLDGPGRA